MNFQTSRTLYYRSGQEWRAIACTHGHTRNGFLGVQLCVTVGKSKIVGAKIHLCFCN